MIKTLLKRVRQYKWKALVTPLFMVGEVAMEVLIPTLMALIIDRGIASSDMDYIWKMSLVLLASAFGALFFGVMSAIMGASASSGFATNLRHDLFGKLQDFSFSDIDKFSSSSLITRLTTDVQNVQSTFQMSIRMLFRSPVMFVFAIIMVAKNGGSLSIVFAIAIPLIIIGIAFALKKTHASFTKAFKGYDAFNMVVQENLSGIRTVKAYVRQEEQEEKFKKAADYIQENFVKGQRIMAITNPLMMLVSYLCMIVVSYLGARLINIGSMATGQLMSIYTYTAQILSSLIMTGMIIVMYSIAWPSMQRITEVLNTVPSMDKNEDGETVVKDGSVSFKDVSFGYKEGVPVLKDINLDIKSGETIGILGTTGSGKSTLISLIACLYDVDSGSLLVGGKNVKDYNLESLRDEVAIVLQKNTLFSGTIAENLRWGNENATDEELRKAAENASALSFILEKPQGFESWVEQGGANFSGGQKQRLCIARALLKNPKILILDDSTSAVDTATDRAIRKSLNDNVKGMTKIIIAQRISSVEDADKIIMMENGHIDDIGTHEELLERNEAYQVLYRTQQEGVLNG